jgi:hypothetical protein
LPASAVDACAPPGFRVRITVDPDPIRAYLANMSELLPNAVSDRISWPLVAVGLGFGALVALACALWVYYGTAVFFEILRAGIAACF